MSINLNQQSFDFALQEEDTVFEKIVLPDAEMHFCKNFYSLEDSNRISQRLLTEIEWQQDFITYYGKVSPLPRLTAWYGDKGSAYKYSGIGMNPKSWTDILLEIKKKVEKYSQQTYNSVLLNLYRHGKDAVSWHQDNEPELGKNPTIASLSFGEARKFQFRHKFRKEVEKFEILLTHGSLLIMKGTTQECWQHQIPKTTKPLAERVNLTFRFIHT